MAISLSHWTPEHFDNPGNYQKHIKNFQKHREKSNFVADSIFNVLESAKVIFKITAGKSVTSAGLSQAFICCFGFPMPSDVTSQLAVSLHV